MALSEVYRQKIADIRDAAAFASSLSVQLSDAETAQDAVSVLLGLTVQAAVLRDASAELSALLIESGGEE